jgi:hypothetical protein
MKDKEQMDEMRRRIQGAISQAKHDELRDKFGMQASYAGPSLPFEAENEWLDYLLEFERQMENAKSITVRERIGNPPVTPLDELPLYVVGDAVESFFSLQPSPYTGWDVVQTSLLDDLQQSIVA